MNSGGYRVYYGCSYLNEWWNDHVYNDLHSHQYIPVMINSKYLFHTLLHFKNGAINKNRREAFWKYAKQIAEGIR